MKQDLSRSIELVRNDMNDLQELEVETFQLESLDDLGVSAPASVFTSSTSSTCCSVVINVS